MNGGTMNELVPEETRQRISDAARRGAREAKRAVPPWGLIILGSALVALGIAVVVMVAT